MEPFVIGIVGVVLLLVLLALGVHLGIALGGVGLVGTMLIIGVQPGISVATGSVFYFVTEYTFVVLPLFVLMGLAAASGGIAQRLYNSFEIIFGRVRGASAIATVSACAAFGTVTGSSIAAAATFTRVSAPQLRRLGYDKSFAYGTIASAATIAMLIPPSAVAIVYGVMAQQSVGDLLLAGIGPGLLMTGVFIVGILVTGRLKPQLIGGSSWQARSRRETFQAIAAMWPVAITALIIIGGIYIGLFTVVEAGAIGAFVIIIIGLSTRQTSFTDIKNNLFDTITTSIMIFFIFFCARIFSRFLALSGISIMFADAVIGLELSPALFIIATTILFLIFGCLLDSISMLAIFIPLLNPVVISMGIDPIWYAMVVIVAIHIGLITPPVGLNVFAAMGVAESDVSLVDIFRGVLPYFWLMMIVLVLVIIFPQISTFMISPKV